MNTANLRKFIREAKNSINGYSDIQILVREATSNDPWGPTSSLMRRIALECENPTNYHDMFKILWKRLTDFHHIKYVHKSLILIDYLLRYGPERFISDMRLRSDVLRKLCFYKYYKNAIESGIDVRTKAKTILGLLDDKELLFEQREAAMSTNKKIVGFSYRDPRVDLPAKQMRPRSMSSPSPVQEKMHVDFDENHDSPLSVVEEKSPQIRSPVRGRAKSVVHEEDDLLSFARSNRKNSVDVFEASGIFSFDLPDEKSTQPMLLFDESFFPNNQMALVPVVKPKTPFDDNDGVMLFENVDVIAPAKEVEIDEQKPEDLDLVEMENESDEIPEDLWAYANVNDIRVTNSEKRRREYALKKKMMMKGKKLNQMEAKHKMEFESSVPFAHYDNSTQALVPYGMQFQQGYQQQQMVPYVNVQQRAADLQWN